jgi:hypothetical protein
MVFSGFFFGLNKNPPTVTYQWEISGATTGGNQGAGAICIVEIDIFLTDGSTISSSSFSILPGHTGDQSLLDDGDTDPDTTIPTTDNVVWSNTDYSVGNILLEYSTTRTDIDYFRVYWFAETYVPGIDFYKNGVLQVGDSHSAGGQVFNPKPYTIDYSA